METKTNVAQPTEFIIPKTTISWHFEQKLKPDDRKVDNYVVIQPGAEDVTKVLQAYMHHPVADYNIASIEIVYNADLNQQFFNNMKLMNKRKGNPKFTPTWRDSTIGEEKAWREATYRKLQTLSANHGDPSLPNVMLLPLWHGTSDTVSEYILDGGYGIFSSNDRKVVTDKGFFGKGVYATHEAEYAFRVYAKQHGNNAVLLLNWVAIYEAYPVIHGDISKLEGKMSGYDQCDAHFIPVRSDSHLDPETKQYDPCAPDQDADYHEVVVFAYQQCLPRYQVKLIQNAPRPSLDDTANLFYQNALIFLKLGQYAEAASEFENAANAGHPGALVRLHWWYSGSNGIYPANPQALLKIQAMQTASVNELKRKANFRGENDQESQFTLAWCYQHGLGCEVDLAKAAKYYWIAAQDYREGHQNAAMQVYRQGYRDAQYQLGVCCASGIGVKPDMKQAIVYYEQAAAQGYVHAHYVLWQCYESGLGIKANPTKAQEHKQAAQQAAILDEKELQLVQQTSALKQKEVELSQKTAMLNQKDQHLKQQQDKAVQDQQKIKELTQAVSVEQQSKNELIARQKEEQKKRDEIITKQNQEKAAQEAQLRDKEQLLQQQTQKATDLSKELHLMQQKLGQKDEMLANKWYENEQLKKDLAESKEREVGLKIEFEAYKTRLQSPALRPQANPYAPLFLHDVIIKPTVLNLQQQEKQNQLVAACLKGDLTLVKQLESQGASFSYPNQEGLYPLVAAVYSCSLETVRYVESKLKNEAEKQWRQVDMNKAKTELDRWTPTELSKNATYGELGDWYAKYQGASWCMYYDAECLKRENYKNWGGWEDGSYKEVTWEFAKWSLWGERSTRVRWHMDTCNSYKLEQLDASRRKNANPYIKKKYRITKNISVLLSPSVEVHDDVVKTIREQMDKLRSEVETKVKRSSAAVLNPIVSVPIQKEQFSGSYSPMLFQPEPQKVLSIPEQVEQTSTVVKEQNKIRQEEVQALLKWVTEGHLVEVEKLLKKNPSLGVCTGIVTDLSDRTFRNITVLQYAAWSLDREMCDLIMDYVDKHNSAIQLTALYAEPKRYSDYGTHYDIKPLIEKTQTYVKNYKKWLEENKLKENKEECKRYWKKKVGGEQRKCPAWLIYAWSEEGADVAWTKQDFSRKIKREYSLDLWFTGNYNSGRGVGTTWAIARGKHGHFLRPWNCGSDIIDNDAKCQKKVDELCVEQLVRLKLASETYANTQTISSPVKK